MLESILASVIATAICSVGARLFVSAKNANKFSKQSPRKTNSKETIKKQFFGFLFTLLFCAILLSNLKFGAEAGLIWCIKAFAYILLGLSFLTVWGTFDAAFSFYPPDDPAPPLPNKTDKNGTDETGDGT